MNEYVIIFIFKFSNFVIITTRHEGTGIMFMFPGWLLLKCDSLVVVDVGQTWPRCSTSIISTYIPYLR